MQRNDVVHAVNVFVSLAQCEGIVGDDNALLPEAAALQLVHSS